MNKREFENSGLNRVGFSWGKGKIKHRSGQYIVPEKDGTFSIESGGSKVAQKIAKLNTAARMMEAIAAPPAIQETDEQRAKRAALMRKR